MGKYANELSNDVSIKDSLKEHTDDNAMLSTIDNPYNPFTDYDEWKAFDTLEGHNTYETLAVLGSFGLLQSRLSEAEFDLHVIATMNRLIDTDPIGLFIKVWPDSVINPIPLENIETT